MHSHLPSALCLLLFAGGASACEPAGEPWLDLRITASEYAGADRTLRVALHDNGCAAIRRPAYFRSPGEYRLAIDAASRERFSRLASSPALRAFDGPAVRAGVAQRLVGRDGEPDALFEVADAGRFELFLRDAGGRRELRFDGVPQYAERFPDLPALAEFNAVVDAAHALIDHPDMRPAAGDAR